MVWYSNSAYESNLEIVIGTDFMEKYNNMNQGTLIYPQMDPEMDPARLILGNLCQ